MTEAVATRPRAQESRYAAHTARSALRAPTVPTTNQRTHQQPAKAAERHVQREQSDGATPSGKGARSQSIVLAADGSNLAIEFDRKRMRHIHVEPDTGTITPEGDWRPVNGPRILRWVHATTPGPGHVDGFASLDQLLAGPVGEKDDE